MPSVVVVGQVARDLVLRIEGMPAEGRSVPVQERSELLGGKGANQAVACRQLKAEVELVGVVGDDEPGRTVTGQAAADGIGVGGVIRRKGAPTALLVDIVESGGVRRLFEDVDERVLLTAEDLRASKEVLGAADAVLVQLQQPAQAVSMALDVAASGGAMVVTDGAPPDRETRELVLRCAAVVRADAEETEALLGWKPRDLAHTIKAAQSLVEAGPRIAALACPTGGNVVAWAEGLVVLPLLDEDPEDPTGAGDAFVAALAISLLQDDDPRSAAWLAAAASAEVVGKSGGRPQLNLGELRAAARRARDVHG
ncbi:PfkB family carbohydrate kinase [Arthrobacter sp. EH-1B-1]|uniref:PfkB family carbohydrate kinase n=1 Tax=Arthrobacter vasquezii TaxID=2977629 RepID=A0ABT6CVR5_9MICC|nr:PfkB family carbohydrate kinase [Arthrobacter vasquezii]MDF9277985.1 PfkB family carbohydrate kinase [Arthrobacter vasquezii]